MPTPPAQLWERLERAKRAGVAFERAWELSVQWVRWPHTTHIRRAWKNAIEETRPAWQAAYEGEPSVDFETFQDLAA